MTVRHYRTTSGDVLVADMTTDFPDVKDISALTCGYSIDAETHYTHSETPEIHAHSVICGPVGRLSCGVHKLAVRLGNWTFEQEVVIS
jgi:hypothetical protein